MRLTVALRLPTPEARWAAESNSTMYRPGMTVLFDGKQNEWQGDRHD